MTAGQTIRHQITVRYGAGSYVARAKGFKPTASSTITAAHAAHALAVKLFEGTDCNWSVKPVQTTGHVQSFTAAATTTPDSVEPTSHQ